MSQAFCVLTTRVCRIKRDEIDKTVCHSQGLKWVRGLFLCLFLFIYLFGLICGFFWLLQKKDRVASEP